MPVQEGCNKEFEIYSPGKLHKTHQNTPVIVGKTHLTFDVNVNTMWYVTTDSCSGEAHQNNTYLLDNIVFYSEIPLPFPNSSYLLEPSNPMANAEMRF